MTAVLKKMALYADLVKFEHTIFALPFALSALLLAAGKSWPPWPTVLWVILAMVGGRTFAMGLNRLIDEKIDGQNPRTQNRALPAGRIQRVEAWLLTLIALGLMTFATFQLPLLCRQLLPVAVAILTLYSYVKRFSSLAHLVLGVALGSSAVGGWIALSGEWSWVGFLFGVAVMLWVAGFDIIYACQDIDFDREAGLLSIPASLGVGNALLLSRLCHGLTVLALLGVGLALPFLGLGYWVAVALTAAMLVYEHRLICEQDLSRVNEAFFLVNGVISMSVLVCLILDKIVR